jgi:hypothetical protein
MECVMHDVVMVVAVVDQVVSTVVVVKPVPVLINYYSCKDLQQKINF